MQTLNWDIARDGGETGTSGKQRKQGGGRNAAHPCSLSHIRLHDVVCDELLFTALAEFTQIMLG